MKYWLLLLLLLPVSVFSQCEDSDKLDFGGTLGSKTRNHIPFDLDITDTIQYCCDIKKIKPYSDFIISKARSFIVARADEGFYNKLTIHGMDVNYPISVEIDYRNQALYNLSNFDVSFWIIYEYTNNDVHYGFGLEFDKNGNMISENMFPQFLTVKKPEEFTSVCDAISVVKTDKRFAGKEVDYIELAYLDEINSFCWLVQEKHGPTKCGVATPYSLDLFYININNNKIEVVKQKKGTVISCCFGQQ